MSDLRLEDLRRHINRITVGGKPFGNGQYIPVTAAEVASACPTEVLIRELRRRGVQPVDLMLPGKGVRIPLEDDEPVAGGVS